MTFKKLLVSVVFIFLAILASAREKEFYSLRVYHLKNARQEQRLDSFLKDAYLPALHRAGKNAVGVFKNRPAEKDTTILVYVLIPFKSFESIASLEEKLNKDQVYISNGKNFIDAAYDDLSYEREETILLSAFAGTELNVPMFTTGKKNRVYELRSYEGPSGKILDNKIDMFTNGGEVALFHRLGFNAIFYGKVIAGSHMPNMMYMTSFENQAERDKHWDAFGKDSEWKKLSAEARYQHNVSRIDIFMLYPTEYSDL
ncbi:MAG: NIPSNAP family protein [Chitinophagaceae bacterium]